MRERSLVLALVCVGHTGHLLAIQPPEEAGEDVFIRAPALHRIVQSHCDEVSLGEKKCVESVEEPRPAFVLERSGEALAEFLLEERRAELVLRDCVRSDDLNNLALVKILEPALVTLLLELGDLSRCELLVALLRFDAVAHEE